MVFKEMVQKEVKVLDNGDIVSNLSDDDKKAINASRSAATAEVADTAKGLVSSISVAAALNARIEGGSVADSVNIRSDRINMKDHKMEIHVYPCAVAKATNFCTAFLKDVTVMKIYVPLRIKVNNYRAEVNDSIREDYVSPFKKKATNPNGDSSNLIIKNTSIKDTILSATTFPENLVFPEEFDKVLSICHKLKMLMVKEFLETIKDSSDDILLAAYRNINTNILEDVFNTVYSSYFGRIDSGDPEQVDRYNNALKDFNDSKAGIGSTFLSNDTLSFGIYVRKMTIAPSVVWENSKKLGRVKQNRAGSYYVSSNEDSGLGAVPITGETLAKHIETILAITDYCMALLESEARAENGFKPLDLPQLPKIEVPKFNVKYRDILGIDKAKEAEILGQLDAQAKEKAKMVCERFNMEDHSTTIDLVKDMMSRRRGE